MNYLYDYLLVGSSGQIGRLLKVYLEVRGRVFIVPRNFITLPAARHVINVGGYTKFDNRVDKYWNDNIRLAIRLATHAEATGACYHQFSSEAVAEYRTSVLRESIEGPIASPKMIDYALSKVLTEQSVRAIMNPRKLYIYRCSDVVPPIARIDRQWRRDHWLSILFSCGKPGFAANDDFPVWIAPVDHLVRAFVLLLDNAYPGAYHLLGNKYLWSTFYKYAEEPPTVLPATAKLAVHVNPVIRIDPPLATCIDAPLTNAILESLEFRWPRIEADYWRRYAHYAITH